MIKYKLRPIAIHLPQFHPIPENDAWWGKGFTEWTNVTKAKPLFKEHYQPKLPADLGFYDLRLEESRIAQAALAKEYGIYGFCYYHYWFNGKMLLEQPVEAILKTGKPDFPFMLCWANENWTRVWDGGNNNVLMDQHYSKEDDEAHIKYLLPFFKDLRYIRINNKPVFAIYRTDVFPDISQTIKLWRGIAAKEGIDLYILRFESQGATGKEYLKEGIDAAVEFQPHVGIMNPHLPPKGFRNEMTVDNFKKALNRRKLMLQKKLGFYKKPKGDIRDYNEFVEREISAMQAEAGYKKYRSVCPAFDNSARKEKDYFILHNSTPALFEKWMREELKSFTAYTEEENLFFINAWNEWAEGNYLEPDTKWGHAYLEAVKKVFSEQSA